MGTMWVAATHVETHCADLVHGGQRVASFGIRALCLKPYKVNLLFVPQMLTPYN